MRLIPDITDILFISALTRLQGDINSIWTLFYLFPIISVARYQGLRGSLYLAGLSILSNVVLFPVESIDWSESLPPLVLRNLIFIGIAFIAGNLTKERPLSEIKLIEVLDEINDEILRGSELQKIYEVILRKAVEITNSRKGHIRRYTEGQNSEVIATIGLNEEYKEQDFALSGSFSNKVTVTRKPIIISLFTKHDIKERLGTYLPPSYPPPRSALFVPLIVKGDNSEQKVVAVIAIHSRKRSHYSKADAIRIGSFSRLLEIAEKQANLYKLLRKESNEKQHRLQLLHDVAKQFEQGYASKATLQRVAELIRERLNSEEAAIFVWEKASRRIVKYAEASPSQAITNKLMEVEDFYLEGVSVTGECFATGKPLFDNDVPPKTQYAQEYGKELPSGKVYHIMVTPLAIGEKRLGVARVINKKATDKSQGFSVVGLDKMGFTQDDMDLLRTITIKVAMALNSADLLDEVETNNRYLERAIGYSPYPMILLDQRGKIKVFNPLCEQIWKTPAREAVGKSVVGFYESEDEARRLGSMLNESLTGRIVDEETIIKDADGDKIPIRLSASLIKDEQGVPLGSIGVFKDLREIKRAEQEILEREQRETIARVMGYVSHDVKNKLIAAKYDVETLQKRAKRTGVTTMTEGLLPLEDTLKVAINKLTNIALTQSFDVNLPNKESVFVEQVFDGCFDHLSRLAASSRTKLSINDFPKRTYKILGDVEQLRLVLNNLYDNSAYAIKKGNNGSQREINVTVRFHQREALIEWKDSGCGIPKRNLSKIFESRFTTKEYGNGLGLYWAKTIIEKHQGKITVDSEEGKWTKFTMQLPLTFEEQDHG